MNLFIYCLFGIQMILFAISAITGGGDSKQVSRLWFQIQTYIMGALLLSLINIWIGQSYQIVYVGAIAILFLFVIMMVPQPSVNGLRRTAPQITTMNPTDSITTGFALRLESESNGTLPGEALEALELLKSGLAPVVDISGTSRSVNPNRSNFPVERSIQFGFPVLIAQGIGIFLFPWTVSDHLEGFALPNWTCDYKTMTSIEVMGYLIYLAVPQAQMQIGIIQWIVMIGVIVMIIS